MDQATRFLGLMVAAVVSACDPSHVAHVDVEVPADVQREVEAQLPMVLYSTAVRVGSPKDPDDGVPMGVLCEAGDGAFRAKFEHYDVGGADEAELIAWLSPDEEPEFDCGAMSIEDQDEFHMDPIETGPIPDDAPRGAVFAFTNPDGNGTEEQLRITIALPEDESDSTGQ